MASRFWSGLLGGLILVGCSGSPPAPTARTDPATGSPSASYDTLAPPTARKELLSAVELDGSFEIEPCRARECQSSSRSAVVRFSPTGEQRWSVDVPSAPFDEVERIGDVVVGRFSGEREGLFAVDLRTGSPLWQRYFDDRRFGSLERLADQLAIRTSSSDDERVELLDVHTGEVTWRSESLGSSSLGRALAVIDDVIVATDDQRIVAYRDGEVAWESSHDSEEVTIVAVGDVIIAHHYPSKVTAHDPATGGELWRRESTDPDESVLLWGAPDGLLVFGVMDRHDPDAGLRRDGVLVLDATTGAPLWEQDELGEVRLFDANLVMEDIEVGHRQVLDLRSGALLWELDAGTRVEAAGGDVLAVTGPGWLGGEQSALVRAADGTEVWALGESARISAVTATAALLLVGTTSQPTTEASTANPGGGLIALRPDGSEVLWRAAMRGAVAQAPMLLDDGDILVAAADPWGFNI